MFIPLIALLGAVHQTPAPVQDTIKDEVVGTGTTARAGDVVDVEYSGKLADGTEFDSSKGRPPLMFVLGLGEVIKGWDQGVVGMREGGTRDLTIPPPLAYGEKGYGPIPANATLSFTVKLVKIEPPVQKTTLVKGSGPGAKLGDVVYAAVKASVQNGNTFHDTKADDPKDPTEPMQIGERGMPIGLITGLLGIQAGETRDIVIPPSLAFRDKGVPPVDQGQTKAGSVVPPNSTIIFHVECVRLQGN
jgi:FKBP-type peptidyl-prolyl cis-trans isomerase